MTESLERHYLNVARLMAQSSPDPSTKVGAIVVAPPYRILGMGCNRFPTRCNQHPDLYGDREFKYRRVIHAEVAALLGARESVAGAILFCSQPTCERCAVHIVEAGIARVVFTNWDSEWANRCRDTVDNALSVYREAGVEYNSYV